MSNPTLDGAQLDPRPGTRQLSVRVLIPLLRRYQRLLRDLDDEGFATSMTELTHALLHAGPTPAMTIDIAKSTGRLRVVVPNPFGLWI